jgi:hypothetical protein
MDILFWVPEVGNPDGVEGVSVLFIESCWSALLYLPHPMCYITSYSPFSCSFYQSCVNKFILLHSSCVGNLYVTVRLINNNNNNANKFFTWLAMFVLVIVLRKMIQIFPLLKKITDIRLFQCCLFLGLLFHSLHNFSEAEQFSTHLHNKLIIHYACISWNKLNLTQRTEKNDISVGELVNIWRWFRGFIQLLEVNDDSLLVEDLYRIKSWRVKQVVWPFEVRSLSKYLTKSVPSAKKTHHISITKLSFQC